MTVAGGAGAPLRGRRVLVTRPRNQAGELVRILEAAGALPVVAPSIRIAPPEDRTPLLAAARESSRFDWIVFASVNAVDAFLQAMHDVGGALSPPTRVCAVGSRTAEQLRTHGIDVAVIPDAFHAEALMSALTARTRVAGARVLLPRSAVGRETIAAGLRDAGAEVTDVIAYRTVADAAEETLPEVRQMLVRRELDAVTFTSGSAVHSFARQHDPGVAALLAGTVVAVIGPVTAAAAEALGIRVDVKPDTFTAAAMVSALADHFARGEA